MQRPMFNMEMIESNMISPKVKHFAFKIIDNPGFTFIPGQFISLHFKAKGQPLKRSYSIASVPNKDNTIEFAATYVDDGPGTELLFNMLPGDKIQTSGPFGRLILREEKPTRYILVGTSSGITPYRSMLPALSKNLSSSEHKVVILQGVQSQEDLLYSNDFLELAKSHENYEFRAYFSRKLPSKPAAHEYAGYVQDAFDDLSLSPTTDIVYLCGNPYMIEEVVTYLHSLDFGPQRIQREKYYAKSQAK